MNGGIRQRGPFFHAAALAILAHIMWINPGRIAYSPPPKPAKSSKPLPPIAKRIVAGARFDRSRPDGSWRCC